MRSGTRWFGFKGGAGEVGLGLLLVLGLLAQMPARSYTQVDLTDGATDRKLASLLLQEGERVVMKWQNSLFRLPVTEVFEARHGLLVLDEITFADPKGALPAEVSPADVDDLYQTGGPFTARGLNKPFRRVVYRVGEIGNPTLTTRQEELAFKQMVGFGGAVILSTTVPTWFEVCRP